MFFENILPCFRTSLHSAAFIARLSACSAPVGQARCRADLCSRLWATLRSERSRIIQVCDYWNKCKWSQVISCVCAPKSFAKDRVPPVEGHPVVTSLTEQLRRVCSRSYQRIIPNCVGYRSQVCKICLFLQNSEAWISFTVRDLKAPTNSFVPGSNSNR